MSDVKKPEYEPVTVFACGSSRGPCKCECATGGPCDHQWDGPWEEFEGGGGGTATCSRCGMSALHHSLWTSP